MLGDGEELRNGVPIAAGDGDFHATVDGGPGQIGAADAIWKIEVQLARSEVDFFRAGGDGPKFGAGVRFGSASQETDEELAGFDVAAFDEWVSYNDIAQFAGCAVNHAGAKAEFAFNGFFDALGESSEVALASAENDVAAIDVSLAAGELQRFVEGAKRIHLDLITADDVDAAEQGNNDGHKAASIRRELLRWAFNETRKP